MNFVSYKYIVFIIAVFFIYWHLRRRHQNIFLLIASWFFYACWDVRYLSLILVSTGVNFLCGAKIHSAKEQRVRRYWLIISIVVNIGMLSYFKYADFFISSFISLVNSVGWQINRVTLEITLPIGISFYTFRSLSYTLDIYSRKLRPTSSFINFAAFVAFFSQLAAGPIVRATELLHQFENRRVFRGDDLQQGGLRFLYGCFKKVCVADILATNLVNPVFADPSRYTTGILWLAMIGYAVQIYADFSGYSSMAIGSARILGFKIPENFMFPYLATNFSSFWRRWHITMSRFFRDYVYIPLGGNRVRQPRVAFNLAVTTLLSGLWHGAAWTFVFWGGLHGICIWVSQMLVRKKKTINEGDPQPYRVLSLLAGWGTTQLMVCLAWVLFRSTDFQSAGQYFSGLMGNSGLGTINVAPVVWFSFSAFIIDHLYGWLKERQIVVDEKVSVNLQALICAVISIFIFHAMPTSPSPFIYFQF